VAHVIGASLIVDLLHAELGELTHCAIGAEEIDCWFFDILCQVYSTACVI